MFGEKLLAVWLWLHSRERSLLKEQSGASAIEYALIIGLVVAVLVGVFAAFGDDLQDLLSTIFEGITDDIEGESE